MKRELPKEAKLLVFKTVLMMVLLDPFRSQGWGRERTPRKPSSWVCAQTSSRQLGTPSETCTAISAYHVGDGEDRTTTSRLRPWYSQNSLLYFFPVVKSLVLGFTERIQP